MAVFYSEQKRGREPVAAIFGAKRLPDGTYMVDILAVAERVQQEISLISLDKKRRVKLRLPQEATMRGAPIIIKNVRLEEI